MGETGAPAQTGPLRSGVVGQAPEHRTQGETQLYTEYTAFSPYLSRINSTIFTCVVYITT